MEPRLIVPPLLPSSRYYGHLFFVPNKRPVIFSSENPVNSATSVIRPTATFLISTRYFLCKYSPLIQPFWNNANAERLLNNKWTLNSTNSYNHLVENWYVGRFTSIKMKSLRLKCLFYEITKLDKLLGRFHYRVTPSFNFFLQLSLAYFLFLNESRCRYSTVCSCLLTDSCLFHKFINTLNFHSVSATAIYNLIKNFALL